MIERGIVVAVEEDRAGTELTAAASATDTTIQVEDVTDFDEDGGQALIEAELVTYLPFDEGDDEEIAVTSLELAAGLAGAHPVAAEVVPLDAHGRPTIERWVHVLVDDADEATEPLLARVTHSLFDRVDEGLEPGTEVVVAHDGLEWYLQDVLGTEPTVDGSYIEPETIQDVVQEAMTDGSPPASSPTPTVQGGISWLAVRWAGTANADPVTYEVHVSDTSGFTPGAGTLSGEVSGTLFFIRALPNGDPLLALGDDGETPVPYYVKLIAKDADGAAAASAQGVGTLVQITSDDIAAHQIVADHIFVGAITADKLQSVLSIVNMLVAGDPEAQRVEIDGQGLRMFAADGETVLVNLPTDPGAKPYFNGDLVAENLQVLGATLLGHTSVAVATDVTLETGVTDPSSAPSLVLDYPTGVNPSETKSWFGLAYNANGTASGDTPVWWTSRPTGGGYWRVIEEYRANGTLSRSFNLPNGGDDDAWGLAILGTHLFVLHQRWSTGKYFIRKYRLSDLAEVFSWEVTSQVTSKKPGLGVSSGGGIMLICGATQASPANLRWVEYNSVTGAVVANVTQNALTVDTRETGSGNTTEFGGMFYHAGLNRHFLAVYSYEGANIVRRGVFAFSGSPGTTNNLSRDTDKDFFGAEGAEADGLTHDGTNFWTVLDGGTFTKHTNWIWTSSDSDKYWVAYTWFDNAGTPHETRVSPRSNLIMRKRAGLRVSWPPIPVGGTDDPNRVRIYMNRGASQPTGGTPNRFAGFLQATRSGTTFLLEDFDNVGTPPENPGANDFPAGTAARIRSDTGGFVVRGDGTGEWPRKLQEGAAVTRGADNNHTSTGNFQTVSMNTVVWSSSSAWATTANNGVKVPDGHIGGRMLLSARLLFADNTTGRRGIRIVRTRGGTPTVLDTHFILAASSSADGLGLYASAVDFDAVAGDIYTLEAFQNSGGNLTMFSGRDKRRLEILHLGI